MNNLVAEIFGLSGDNKQFQRIGSRNNRMFAWDNDHPWHRFACLHTVTGCLDKRLNIRGEQDALSRAAHADTARFIGLQWQHDGGRQGDHGC